jgi:hypothetical protein
MMIDWDRLLSAGDQPPALAEPGQPEAWPAASRDTDAAGGLPGVDSPERSGDNRRRCCECAKLGHGGRCLAAVRREIVASRTYAPHPDLLRRCEAFAPLPNDPDQRPVRDRWPGL